MTRASYETVIRETVETYVRHFEPSPFTQTADAVVTALLARPEIPCFDLVRSIKQEFAAHA